MSSENRMQMNNLIILDKNVFQGTAQLLKFVECHNVILPYSLFVECIISRKGEPPRESKDPKRLLNKYIERSVY